MIFFMEKYTSKLGYSNLQYKTLRTGIPKEIKKHLNLDASDSLKWTIDSDGRVTVEKLIL